MNAAGHLSPAEAAAFSRRDSAVPPAERLAISDHVATCAVCQALLVGARAEAEAGETVPNLTRIFAGLIEAGRQDEHPALEPWLGGAEFSAGSPQYTPAEEEERRNFEAQLNEFDREQFAPGGTLEAASEAKRGDARRTTPSESSGFEWWQRLFSWQSLTLAGALAVVALALLITLPNAPMPTSGPVAATTQSEPRPDLVDGPVQVSADGTLAGLASIPGDLRDAVAETIRRGAAPGALLGKLTRGGETKPLPEIVSPVDPAVAVALSPVGTSIDTEQPTLRWKAPLSRTFLVILVRPSAGGEEIRSVPLAPDTAEWTPTTPLPRGALYRWQILSVTPEGQEIATSTSPKVGAVFKILSADAHARLETLRAGPSGQSHLTLGVAYAREGLREDAAREFRALQESNAQSVLAKRLVDSLEGKGG